MLLTLFSSGGGGGGGGAVANYANAGGSGVTSVDTSASPFTSTTGSTFVICVSYNSNSGAPTSVTDNKGNTYVLKLNQTTAVNGRIYVCENGTGGAGHYATVSLPFTDYPSLHFMELTGVPAGSFDQVVGAADFSSPYTATTGTLAQANELVLSYISADGSGGADTYAETSGFTLLGQVNDSSQYWPSAVAYKVVSATTAVPTSWTVTPSVGNTAVIVAGFKVSAAPTGYTLSIDPVNYSLTAAAETVAATRALNIAPTSYSLSAAAVTLTYASAVKELSFDPVAYALTAQSETLTATRQLNIAPVSYAVSAAAETLTATRALNIAPVSYSLSAANTTLDYGTTAKTLVVDPVSYSLTLPDVTLLYSAAVGGRTPGGSGGGPVEGERRKKPKTYTYDFSPAPVVEKPKPKPVAAVIKAAVSKPVPLTAMAEAMKRLEASLPDLSQIQIEIEQERVLLLEAEQARLEAAQNDEDEAIATLMAMLL